MKKFTDDELNYLHDLAHSLMPIADMAVLLEIPEQELRDRLADKETEAAKKYTTGYLQAKASIRKSIVDLAINGSSPAQTLAIKFIGEMEFDKG